MDYVGALLGSFVVFGFVVDGLLRRTAKKSRRFLTCRTCDQELHAAGVSKFMPSEVSNYLDKHGLPTPAASRFVCPKGHYQLWFIPKFGNTERAFFFKEEL